MLDLDRNALSDREQNVLPRLERPLPRLTPQMVPNEDPEEKYDVVIVGVTKTGPLELLTLDGF
jgi:hypothetical protein